MEEPKNPDEREQSPPADTKDSKNAESPPGMDDDHGDPFSSSLFGSTRGPGGLGNTLRALSGMMSGMSSRLRDILTHLRQTDNPTMQMIALEELSNLLLVSNEDNLSGQFSPDPYIKELVALMQPNPITGEENPEIMLLACRCLANLMEALRGSVANVVYGGAVPVLCQKLLDIQFIDVAEQALSTLSKVSVDFPASIVREGGLTACLQFLDFFATGTQRTAVTTAANCCRNIPQDSFPVIKDVMPILQNVLASHDQKVVEQGCLCVTRVIDSFKRSPDKLEELVDAPLLRAILGLLLPGTTNLIGPNIHTEFLRVLAIVARASPRLSAELLKLNVVDTIYQILTGVSPPTETSDAASKIDSVVIMQALIHRPKDQISEALNVICELLPRPKHELFFDFEHDDTYSSAVPDDVRSTSSRASRIEERQRLLSECKAETRRFSIILLPTLTDAYSSTVNLSVRQKVLTAHLKILCHIDSKVVQEALRPVPYASFLASILSQQDHSSLVIMALQASELLIERLEGIYQYQFYREGVIGEIQKLAARKAFEGNIQGPRPVSSTGTANPEPQIAHSQRVTQPEMTVAAGEALDEKQVKHGDRIGVSRDLDAPVDNEIEGGTGDDEGAEDENIDEDHDDTNDDDEDDDGEDDDQVLIHDGHNLEEDEHMDDDDDTSNSSDDEDLAHVLSGIDDLITLRAQKLLERFETAAGPEKKQKASAIRQSLQVLAKQITSCYGMDGSQDRHDLFVRLAKFFDGDALETITSSELLDSNVIQALLEVLLPTPEGAVKTDARLDFTAAFNGSSVAAKLKGTLANQSLTPMTILIQKLQDLLSRAEHFEVLTVNSNASESSRGSSTSLLSRQIRLRLNAEGEGDIPTAYRELIVSIHAIATFKALDDYLRPKMTMSDRPYGHSQRRDMLQKIANARMAQLAGASESGLLSPFGTDLSMLHPPGSTEVRSASRFAQRPKTPVPNENLAGAELKSEKRRSTRRLQPPKSQSENLQPISTPVENAEVKPTNLECADEKNVDDSENNIVDHDEAIAEVVDHLEDDMSDDEMPEPSAVSMEVASTGKVTARQEDGTRVVTPLPPGTPVPSLGRAGTPGYSPGVPPAIGGSIASAGRPYSYASAVSTPPQDWHLEFSIDEKPIPSDTTIYRAIYHGREQREDTLMRNVWSNIHCVKYKKVKGPPPQSTIGSESYEKKEDHGDSSLPASLSTNPTTASILSLLSVLHDLNQSLEDMQDALPTGLILQAEPLASFINTKLTAKMNRQLEEPLIVASSCLPGWSEDLARLFPFLFPFETRYLFLQSTSFGYSRSMARWQSTQSENDERRDRRRDDRQFMGRLLRQKVRIARSRILESAVKVMEMYGDSPSVLEVEYFEEVGTGLGPTLEFYSTISKEFSKKKLQLWRENDSDSNDEYAFGKNGLFPAPMSDADAETDAGKKLLNFFRMLGKFVARSMLDSRIIDVSFNPAFFRLAGARPPVPSIALVKSVDSDLANSLVQLSKFASAKAQLDKDYRLRSLDRSRLSREITVTGAHVEDMMLDFTLPGYPDIDLIEKGSDASVTIENVQSYIDRVVDLTLGSGVKRQLDAFKQGFSQVFSYSSLQAFTPNELVMLFGRVEEDWTMETLMDSIKADHGFNMDSKSIKNLLQTMSELGAAQRRDFLQFVTGSPKLPIGGFRALTPSLTVVCKPSEPPYTSDDYLPSVMTCVNYLKLPDYTNLDVLRERLNVAIREGQGAFHLS